MVGLLKQREFVRVILINAGKVLAMQDLNTGLWNFPGGKVSPHETFRTAAIREVWEEVGVRIHHLVLVAEPCCYINGEKWIGKVYMSEIKSGSPAVKEPHKCKKMLFLTAEEAFSLKAIPEVLGDPLRVVISRNLISARSQRENPSEYADAFLRKVTPGRVSQSGGK